MALWCRRHRYGRQAESLREDQLELALEEAEQTAAADQAASEQHNPAERKVRAARCRINRGKRPAHLPGIETVIDVPSRVCPWCAGTLHRIGQGPSARSGQACRGVWTSCRPSSGCGSHGAPRRVAALASRECGNDGPGRMDNLLKAHS